MNEWQNKTILITGGSSGIGKSTAFACAKRGAKIGILGHTTVHIQQTVEELKAQGYRAFGYVCDVSDLPELTAVSKQIKKEMGFIDVLINNAGYATYRTFEESDIQEIDKLTRVNYLGLLYACKLFLPDMVKRKQGHIINVASVAGRITITPNPVYCAAKHAVVAITDLLRCEYREFGVTFSLILPGRVDTPFFDHETFKRRLSRPEHRGMIKPETVAAKIVHVIETRKREIFIPRIYAPAAWVITAVPWVFRPLLERVLVKRIRDHYATPERIASASSEKH